MSKQYTTFKQFYPFYLSQHQNSVCRRLHFVGSTLVLLLIVYVLITASWLALTLAPVVGYGCAWLGHYIFEKNQPATFTYPIYSLIGDWVMYKDILIGKISL